MLYIRCLLYYSMTFIYSCMTSLSIPIWSREYINVILYTFRIPNPTHISFLRGKREREREHVCVCALGYACAIAHACESVRLCEEESQERHPFITTLIPTLIFFAGNLLLLLLFSSRKELYDSTFFFLLSSPDTFHLSLVHNKF